MDTSTEHAALIEASRPKLEAMRAQLRGFGSALVAFSGGVDSTFVLAVAVQELGDRAVALTAISESVAPEERAEAKALAERIGVKHVLVGSAELSNPEYAKNPTNRCYFCKTELYDHCIRVRDELGLSSILDGFNADDFKDHRPGHQAAREHGITSPLAQAGLTKAEIRAWSLELGLPTWNKPQMACLASRIPYGSSVTREKLFQVASAETALRSLGFRQFRVRHHGEIARLEISSEEQVKLEAPAMRERVNRALKGCGYTFVAVDLEPFRSGRMNEAAGITSQPVPLPVLS